MLKYRVSQKICYIPGSVINAAVIVLFESTIGLNNLSSDKKHNFIIGRLIFSCQ